MAKIGLIAGSGVLPLEFVKSAKKEGEKVVVFALEGMAPAEIEELADRTYWVNVGQYKKFVFLLAKEMIRRLAFIGKVDKGLIYGKGTLEKEASEGLKALKNKKDTSIFEEITRRLNMVGVEVVEATRYLSHMLPEKGVLSSRKPDAELEEDISFGYETAKKLAGMDIGQAVVVKGKAVVAVEAMEGTDATVSRAKEVAGDGCVMVKTGRPDQDMRWDVPTVGPDTVAKLIENGFKALAIESGKMFLLEKEKTLQMADDAGLIVKVV